MGVTARYDLGDPSIVFRPDVLDDPTALYVQLRTEAPVWEIPGAATFVVTSCEAVTEAVGRTDDFSSNLASLVFRGDDGCPRPFDMAPLGDATHVLATADPPVHTAHRKLLQPHLTPACVDRLESDVVAMVDALLAPVLAAGGGDVVPALADPLPMQVIARVIGLPAEDVPRLVRLVLDVDEILTGIGDADGMARAASAAMEQATYLAGHLHRVLADPGAAEPGTLLAVVAPAVTRGEATVEEAVGMLVQLLSAGSETTTSLIASAVQALADDPNLQGTLRTDPAVIPAFLEEVLRLEGPFRFHYRTTRRPTTLQGVAIPAGARVMLMWAAANLDEHAHADATELRLDRAAPRGHLAFGRGIHFCIGAPLARMEARVAIERLLATTSRVRPDPAGQPRLHPSIFMRRLAALPVVADAS
jgi:cytochrome P450 family 144